MDGVACKELAEKDCCAANSEIEQKRDNVSACADVSRTREWMTFHISLSAYHAIYPPVLLYYELQAM